MKLLIIIDLEEKYIEMIREEIGDIEIVKTLNREVQKKEIVDADILIVGFEADQEVLAEARQLAWIQTWSAGVENFIDDEVVRLLKDKNIRLASMSGIHGGPIAETVIGYIINFSRRLHEFYQWQQEKEWHRLELEQLEGKTMVIVGTGSIGQEIARRAKAFKMKTIGVKRKIKGEVKFIDSLFTNSQLGTALKEGDFVVVTVPLTEETEGMFAEREFAIMKETAFFVNIARGTVVAEDALISALEQGEIAGAGLDVFVEEPLAAGSPLYELENVFITPHISGEHPEYNLNGSKLFIENLKNHLSGSELKTLVDYSQGY